MNSDSLHGILCTPNKIMRCPKRDGLVAEVSKKTIKVIANSVIILIKSWVLSYLNDLSFF